MSFYKDYKGNTAKVINSYAVIVMLEYRTFFFPDMDTANSFLNEKGYKKI